MIDTLIVGSWERVRELLAAAVGPEADALWFGRSRVRALQRGVLSVALPSVFMRDWVQDNYGALLDRLASEVVGAGIRVALVVEATGPEGARVPAAAVVVPAEETDPLEGKTLDTWVPTAGSELALRAVRHVARGLRPRLNPLLVCGPEGSGKSHLASGLAQEFPARSRIYRVGGDEFAHRFSWHLKTRRLEELRVRVQESDLLIVDTFEELAGKSATQRELSLLMQSVMATGGQVVVFSRLHPSELPNADAALASVVLSGMSVALGAPVGAERLAVVERIFQSARRRVPRAVIALLAARSPASSVKRLDREIRKIYAYAGLTGEPVTEEWLDRHASELSGPADPDVRRFEMIVTGVLEHFRVERDVLLSKRKTKAHAVPRAMIVWLLREQGGMTFKTIGRMLGDRSHTSVFLMHQKLMGQIASDVVLQRLAKDIGRRIVTASVP